MSRRVNHSEFNTLVKNGEKPRRGCRDLRGKSEYISRVDNWSRSATATANWKVSEKEVTNIYEPLEIAYSSCRLDVTMHRVARRNLANEPPAKFRSVSGPGRYRRGIRTNRKKDRTSTKWRASLENKGSLRNYTPAATSLIKYTGERARSPVSSYIY